LCVGRHPHFQSICESGEKLRSEGHLASKAIGHRLTQLQDKWKKLTDMATVRKTRLEEAAQSQHVSTEGLEKRRATQLVTSFGINGSVVKERDFARNKRFSQVSISIALSTFIIHLYDF